MRSPARHRGSHERSEHPLRHLYLDESKARTYIVAAAVVATERRTDLRHAMTGLRLPGQSRIHMVSEGAQRRRTILSTLCDIGVDLEIYQATQTSSRTTARTGRAACLREVVNRSSAAEKTQIVLELDESLRSQDRQTLLDATGAARCRDRVDYVHEPARHEPLLWIADAGAWAWARGGEWQKRIRPAVRSVHDV